MVDLGSIGSEVGTYAWGWLRTGTFWIIGIIVVIILFFVIIKVRKKRKLVFPCEIITELGGGKVGIKKTKCGWFGSKTAFFGLIDYGKDDIMKTKEGLQIQKASSEDFHDINGKRGIVCQKSSTDPKILLPISKIVLDNNSQIAINSIAPADFRDTSAQYFVRSTNELKGTLERYLPIILFTGLIVMFIIGIILINQMMTKSQESINTKLTEVTNLYNNLPELQARAMIKVLTETEVLNSNIPSNAP